MDGLWRTLRQPSMLPSILLSSDLSTILQAPKSHYAYKDHAAKHCPKRYMVPLEQGRWRTTSGTFAILVRYRRSNSRGDG